MSTTAALLAALGSTVVLAGLHLLAARVSTLPHATERATASFAGGIAVSYVFLHLLPELAEGNERLRELFHETQGPSGLAELGIFVVALGGFLLFYGLERWAASQRRPTRTTSGLTATEDDSDASGSFRVHLGAFAVYNGVITYTLPSTYRTGIGFAVLFTIAMGLHFVLSDRGLREHYGPRFSTRARAFLVVALFAGWVLAAIAAPTRAVTVSVLTAFLAGGILLNVFKEEIPAARRSSFAWFVTGTGLYAGLIAAETMLAAG